MDTIDCLFNARVSSTAGPMQRCRARDPKHKHGSSVAFIKEWPQMESQKIHNNTATSTKYKSSSSNQPVWLAAVEDATTKAYEGFRKLPELIVTAPPQEERAASTESRRPESPAKRFLRSWM